MKILHLSKFVRQYKKIPLEIQLLAEKRETIFMIDYALRKYIR